MRFSQLLLLLIVAFVACSSSIATAENSVRNSEIDATREITTSEDRRFLKGSQKSTELDAATEERVGATTPSMKQFLGIFRLPKFQTLGKVPGFKQLNAIRKKFGEQAGKLYLKFVKARYNANPNNFM
jgi:ABC-type Fe3+-hydroxamate transport system substrate-binding protein